ncbi:uncharacterized protein LOC143437174 [Arvicanthis niloticus]|uniref:uncharacterized protein LOC143310306 n=1 Tax=Arvicanthis niloticus TaxID=61156 RepID=UPI00402BA9EA
MPQKSWVEGGRRVVEAEFPGGRSAAPELRFASRAPPPPTPPTLPPLVRGRCPGYRGRPGPAATARPAPGCSPAGDAGPRGGNFGFPPPSPLARGRRSTAAARPPASRARSHSRLAHGRPPAPPRHAHTRSAPPAAARACRAPLQSTPRPPRPISLPPGATVPGSAAPRLQPGGAEGRARGWAGARLRRPGESRQATPGLALGRLRDALGAGRCGRGARGSGRGAAPAPGGSPTRGSCCLNAGALPSRRLPRPAQPRPPGAPVPFVPGRCSLPRERRDWSARTEPPSRIRSAAARLTAEAPGRVKSRPQLRRHRLRVALERPSSHRGFSGVTGPQLDTTAPALESCALPSRERPAT